MTDQQVLGLTENFSIDELKKAFRKKSRQFHPDLNDNQLNSHLAMIRVNQAYSNLLKTVKEASFEKEPDWEEQAYRYYKEGISKFQSIHPSKWKSLKGEGLFNPHAIETNPDTLKILDELIDTLSRSYHCFSTVVNEYPESCWARDAGAKLQEIEKQTIRYGKIRESYRKEF